MARRRLPGSWMVSASVKSSQRPRARRAAVQMALFLPVQPGSSLRRLHHRHSGKAAGNLRRPVGRVIVHHDQLPIPAQLEDLFRLADQRLQARAQALLLVARRDNDRQLDQLLRLRLVENRSRQRFFRPIRASPLPELALRRIGKPKHRLPPATRPVCGGPLALAASSLPIAPHRFRSCPFAPYYKDVRFPRFLILTLLLPLALSPACNRGAHPAQTGKAAPDFTVSDGTTTVHLASYRGRVVLLNFWATWCAPCVVEMPSLLELHHDQPDLAILAVSIDEDPDAYSSFHRPPPRGPDHRARPRPDRRPALSHRNVAGNLRHRPQGRHPPQVRRRRRTGPAPRSAPISTAFKYRVQVSGVRFETPVTSSLPYELTTDYRSLTTVHCCYHRIMTTVEILYRYATPPTEQVALALARARDVYGIRRLSFDRGARTLRVEFDATRLDAAEVSKLVREAGLDIAEELQQ